MSIVKKVIAAIKNERRLFGTCPCCDLDFRLSAAELFAVNEDFPAAALSRIEEIKEVLKDRRDELRKAKERMTTRSQITAKSVNLGKMLGKIVPSFNGFHFTTRDCRSLLEPIDYIVFSGLHSTGAVETITFLDVKSGAARLTPMQREISASIQRGNVELDVISSRKKQIAAARSPKKGAPNAR